METPRAMDGTRKRQRTDSDEASGSDHAASRSEPWLEDGNVILVSSDARQFRVHRSILATSSPIFKDMFGLGQPGAVVDECPIVQLSDTERDLRHMLQALYDRTYYRPDESPTFETTAALLRLGSKYYIRSLRRDALAVLDKSVPKTLSLYDELPRGRRVIQTCGVLVDLCDQATLWGILEISRDLDLPFFRPATMLLLCRWYTLEEVLDVQSLPWSPCRQDDLRLLMIGRREIERLATRTYAWAEHNACQTRMCREHFQWIRGQIMRLNVRNPAFSRINDYARVGFLCPECREAATTSHHRGRSLAWQELPDIFGCSGWDELEISKARALSDEVA